MDSESLDEVDGMENQTEIRYASGSEIQNPYYVIVHEQVLERYKIKDASQDKRVREELERIKSNHDWISFGDPKLDPKLPKDRTFLCAGFFEGHSVLWTYQNLRDRGYDIYISKEGVLPSSAFQLF